MERGRRDGPTTLLFARDGRGHTTYLRAVAVEYSRNSGRKRLSTSKCGLLLWEVMAMSVLQGSWSWCRKCEGLFYSGNPSFGVCPADGQSHDPMQSGHYVVYLDAESLAAQGGTLGGLSAQQGGWRWCRKCQGMFFAENTQGVCPVDRQAHDSSQSGHYAIVLDDGVSSLGQKDWRWCQNCQGLFYSGHSNRGACPARGPVPGQALPPGHDASTSGNYQVQFAQASPR